jgi:hypothetical protein
MSALLKVLSASPWWGPSFVSFHKTTLYQMHLDGINIFPHNFVATITTWTMYLLCPRNLGMLLRNRKKVC